MNLARFERVLAGALLLTFPGGALLRGAEAVKLDQIEVTARSEVRDRSGVTGAITAYGGDFLAANGISDFQDLAAIVPGLFVASQSVDNVSLNLRGLTSDSADPRAQPQILVFQDGVMIANSHGNSVALFDAEDVAVFKGPQSTAFGRGVSGGALALSSHRAVNARTGSLTLGAGERNAFDAEFVLNRPVVAEKLFARVAVLARRSDGYVKNLADGSELQGEGTVAVRTSLRWQPTAAATVDLTFNFQRDDTPGVAVKSMTGVPGLPPIDTNPFTPANLNRGAGLGLTRTIIGVTGIVKQKLSDAWTLAATSAWREVTTHHEFDADGSPYYLFEGGERYHGWQLSQEVRLDYATPGPLTAAVGANFFQSKDTQTFIVRSDENDLWRFFMHTPPPFPFNPRYAEQNTTGAATTAGDGFGRADYKLTRRLTLGAGLRMTQERLGSRIESFAASPRGNLVGLLPTSGGANDLLRDSNGPREHPANPRSWAGQADALYAVTPQLTAFALVSRGRRPPVLDNDPLTFATRTHAEETVWNYEVGLKGASASRRFRYEVSVFHYDFEHFQTQRMVSPGFFQVYDGGRARGHGAEAAVQAELAREVSAFTTYGFTDAEFSARDAGGAPQLYAGNTFRLTSRHVLSIGGTLSRSLEGGAVFFTPLFTYRSRYYFEDDNAQNGGILRQGGTSLTNIRFGYRPRGGRWEVVGYAHNLFDKEYLLDAGNTGGAYGIPTSTPAAPRMIGVKTTVRF